MSRMTCLCGGSISDSLHPCPTLGWIVREQDEEGFFEGAARDIAAFIAAVHSGQRDAWIAEFFSPRFGSGRGDEFIVYAIIGHHKRRVYLSISECEQCGRLWIQRGPGINGYRSYLPDEPGYAGVLRSAAETSTNQGL